MDISKNQKIALGVSAAGLMVWLLFFRNTVSGDGIDPTIGGAGNSTNGFDAHKIAVDLYMAMKDSGTDEDAVVAILTPVTPAQFDLVVPAFGKLKYNPVTGNQYSFWGTLDPYDLKGWLYEEISSSMYANLRRKYPKQL
ncbi:MAG TPA: hypothetical protein VK528_14390 [Flavobacterium sp.]|nr:hypothetical protein [Flavobacterium sp.]